MTKEKELGYKLGDVIWHNLEGYQELWNKADFDTKEKIINELGRLAIELTIPAVVKSLKDKYAKKIDKWEKEYKKVYKDDYLYKNNKEEWLRRIKYLEGKLFVMRHF